MCGVDSSIKIIDEDIIESLKELVGDGFANIVEVYIKTASELMDNIGGDLEKSDNQGLVFNAHTLKSSSAQLGVMLLSDIARQMEELGLEEKSENCDELYADAKEVFESVKIYMQELLLEN